MLSNLIRQSWPGGMNPDNQSFLICPPDCLLKIRSCTLLVSHQASGSFLCCSLLHAVNILSHSVYTVTDGLKKETRHSNAFIVNTARGERITCHNMCGRMTRFHHFTQMITGRAGRRGMQSLKFAKAPFTSMVTCQYWRIAIRLSK